MSSNVVNIDSQKLFSLNEKGNIRANSPHNVLLCFKKDERLSANLRHNNFSQEHELINDITLGHTVLKKGELPANFDSIIKVFFEKNVGVVFTNQALTDGLETFFAERSYNPVLDYMEKAETEWDGKKRIETMLQTYLGAEERDLVSKIAKIWLVGAVAKVYDPFVKFDYVLDLVGGQGVGKTSFLQKLGGQWYTDSVTDFVNKDNYDIMLKSLIVNDDEMVASNRMDFAEIKAFVSKTSIRYRKPYLKRTEEFAKNFVIARTSNHVEYLKDRTGERRFLPVLARNDYQTKKPTELTEEKILQIWGEAVTLYKKGEALFFDEETEKELVHYREKFMYIDAIEQQVLDYLAMPIPEIWEKMQMDEQKTYTKRYFNNDRDFVCGMFQMTRVSTREIMFNVFDRQSSDQKLSKKISLILDTSKDWEKKVFRCGKKSVRGYVKKFTK